MLLSSALLTIPEAVLDEMFKMVNTWSSSAMARTSKRKSDGLDAAMYEMAAGLHRAGVLGDQAFREFQNEEPVPSLSPEEIRALRERENVSELEFSVHLNVSKDSVRQWERGQTKPAGAAMKLLSLVQRKGLDAIR